MNTSQLPRQEQVQDRQSHSDTRNHVNVLTVHYNTQPFIENLVELLGKEMGLFFRFVIVDNSRNLDRSRLKTCNNIDINIIRGGGAQTTVLESHRSALNIGLKYLDFQLPHTLFLDPDVIFSQNAISNCKKSLEENKLSAIGVHKFYQYKTGTDILYPYIWFTLIRTRFLAGFTFKKVQPHFFNLFTHARKDTGDSLYALIEGTKMPFRLIKIFLKKQQSNLYPLVTIQTDDWLDQETGVVVSHYRGGSDERKSFAHPFSGGNDSRLFIEKSASFTYSHDFLLESHQ